MPGVPIEALRMGVGALIADFKTDAQALETAWLSVIVFASDAWQTVPLTELVSFSLMFPIVDSADESALGAALMVLSRAIDREVIRRTVDISGDYCLLVIIMIDNAMRRLGTCRNAPVQPAQNRCHAPLRGSPGGFCYYTGLIGSWNRWRRPN
jgi:uncharacterized protein YegL